MSKFQFSLSDLICEVRFVAYDNEGADPAPGTPAAPAAPAAPADPAAPAAPGTPAAPAAPEQFSDAQQEQVNKILAEDRRKHQAKVNELKSQLEVFGQSNTLSEQQKSELETTMADLQKQLMTSEQQAALQKQQMEEKYTVELDTARTERDQWKHQYESSTIGRALMDASIAGDAFNPAQIVALLKPNTKLVKNEETGVVETKIDFNDIHAETGEPVLTQLTPTQAITRMKELTDNYGNLFNSNVVKGVSGGSKGEGGSISNRKVDVKNMSPAEYAKMRKENPAALGL